MSKAELKRSYMFLALMIYATLLIFIMSIFFPYNYLLDVEGNLMILRNGILTVIMVLLIHSIAGIIIAIIKVVSIRNKMQVEEIIEKTKESTSKSKENMKFCNTCGKEIKSTAQFCESCGSPQ